MKTRIKLSILGLLFTLTLALGLAVSAVSAQTATLTVNSGVGSVTWFITGEPSLVMNGFDLDRFSGVSRPIIIDSVSINVVNPVLGRAVDVVIYGDSDGGSPSNATLLRRQTVPDIGVAGLVTINLDAPLTFDGRYLWVGFYLPVGFEFAGDRSGVNNTYWAWTPDGTFDLNNLASAQVQGRGDGSAPVNLNMRGSARITVGVRGNSGFTFAPVATTTATPVRQLVGTEGVNLAPLVAYSGCSQVFYDSEDINITYASSVRFYCRMVSLELLPPVEPEGYNRRGILYDVYVFGVPSGTQSLPYPVTHCIKPPPQHLDTALIGVAQGAPRQWTILPTVRFGEFICAELKYVGFVSFFTPR